MLWGKKQLTICFSVLFCYSAGYAMMDEPQNKEKKDFGEAQEIVEKAIKDHEKNPETIPSPMHQLCSLGINQEIIIQGIKILKACEYNIDYNPEKSGTPFLFAVANANAKVAEYLLYLNANVNARDSFDFTAMDYALQNKYHLETDRQAFFILLLIRGATPFQKKFEKKYLELIKQWLFINDSSFLHALATFFYAYENCTSALCKKINLWLKNINKSILTMLNTKKISYKKISQQFSLLLILLGKTYSQAKDNMLLSDQPKTVKKATGNVLGTLNTLFKKHIPLLCNKMELLRTSVIKNI